MAENEKDNKDFEFIKEQVIEKKRKKIKKRLLPILATLFLAILFGLVAAVTFALSEPGIYDFLHEEDVGAKSQITFPTPTPELQVPVVTKVPEVIEGEGDDTDNGNTGTDGEVQLQPYPVIQKIDASIGDFTKMYGEIRKMANEVDKSIVDVASTFTVVDWFNKTVDKIVNSSGVIVADNKVDLLILVSLDKVHDATSVRLKFSDSAYVDAIIQDYESEINLALLAVAKEDIPPIYLSNLQVATLGESNYTLTVGNPVIALGSPDGHTDSMDIGIITSEGSSWASITDNKLELFNTDIEDNADSDGIIVNLKGEIIGIITRTLKEDVNKEISTAIGISEIQPYIEKMSNQNPRIYFGIKAEDMTESAKQEYTITNGIYVSEVQSDSPAFDAGMKRGDIILSINDETILNMPDFNNVISKFEPDTEINVKIKRTSGTEVKEMELKVVLTEKAR